MIQNRANVAANFGHGAFLPCHPVTNKPADGTAGHGAPGPIRKRANQDGDYGD